MNKPVDLDTRAGILNRVGIISGASVRRATIAAIVGCPAGHKPERVSS